MPLSLPTRRLFFAILHRPSGGFLPAVRGFGFTRTEPTKTEPPRLFAKIGPCRQALNYWLEGEHFEGLDNDEGVTIVKVTPRPERKLSSMEIVEIELTPRSLADAQIRRL